MDYLPFVPASDCARAGDHVLSAGDSVLLRAGQSVVMQAWARQGLVQVQWEAAPVVKGLPGFGAASRRVVRLLWLARLVQRLARGPASAPLACGR